MESKAVSVNIVQEKAAGKYGVLTAIKSNQGEIVALAVNSEKLSILEGYNPKELKTSKSIKRTIENPGGVCKDKNDYFIIDSKQKLLFRMAEGGRIMRPELLLGAKGSDVAISLINSPGSVVSDLHIIEGKLWFVCRAGYSSSVCSFDLKSEKEEVIITFNNIFPTKGSRPNGILFDEKEKTVMVIDTLKNMLVRYSPEGEALDVLKVEFNDSKIKDGLKPDYVAKGLALDKNHNIWVLESRVEDKEVRYK